MRTLINRFFVVILLTSILCSSALAGRLVAVDDDDGTDRGVDSRFRLENHRTSL